MNVYVSLVRFVLLCSFAISLSVNAQTINTENLSSQQINQLAEVAANMRKDPAKISEKVRDEVQAWTDLGQNIGRATVGAAKEVGMATNEFAQTPLGIITTSIVVYKLIGEDILSLIFGSLLILFGSTLGIYASRQGYNRTYEYKPIIFGMFNYKMIKSETIVQREVEIQYICYALIAFSWLVGLIIIL